MYKVSIYNVIRSTESGKSFLINTRTTAVLDVSSSPLVDLSYYLTGPNEISEKQFDDRVLNVLLDNGFILPNGFDEAKWVKKIHLDARAGENAFALGVVLTLACNFRCTYCYEEHDNVHISDHLSDSIIKFTSANLRGKKRFRIAWFGGEPLLRKHVIESLTHRFIKICDKNNIAYSARMSTNGYLLTRDVALLLKECHVSDIQVTLDGPPETHDKRRFLINGKPTFEKIYDNVKSSADLFDRFTIRINIDNQNADSIPTLLKDYLYPIRDKILVSFSIAMSPESPDHIESWTTPPHEFWEIEKNLGLLADQLGFRVIRGYPIPCTSFCMGYQNNSFLVDPYGHVNLCPKFLGMKEQSYGHLLSNGNIVTNKNSIQASWGRWSPFSDADCKTCKVLPLCMGGCLLFLPSNKHKDLTHRCFAKYNLVDSILRETYFMELVGSAQKLI